MLRGRKPGMLAGDALPAGRGPRDGAQPSVSLADPPHQIGVVAGQQRKQRGAVERPPGVQPAPHHRIDLACEVGEVVTRSCGAAAIRGSAR